MNDDRYSYMLCAVYIQKQWYILSPWSKCFGSLHQKCEHAADIELTDLLLCWLSLARFVTTSLLQQMDLRLGFLLRDVFSLDSDHDFRISKNYFYLVHSTSERRTTSKLPSKSHLWGLFTARAPLKPQGEPRRNPFKSPNWTLCQTTLIPRSNPTKFQFSRADAFQHRGLNKAAATKTECRGQTEALWDAVPLMATRCWLHERPECKSSWILRGQRQFSLHLFYTIYFFYCWKKTASRSPSIS